MGELEKTTKKAYYVSLSTEGVPKRVESDDITDVLKLLHEDSLEWMDFALTDINAESVTIATALGFSSHLLTTILSNRFSAYEDNETELGLMMPAVRVQNFDVKIYPLLILIRKNLVVTIHPAEIVRLEKLYKYAEIFMKKIRHDLLWNDKLTILITRILDENNERNFMGLRAIEEDGDELGKCMVDVNAPRVEIGDDIYHMKHALITYLNALWASLDVINSLRYGDAEVITDTPKLLQHIGMLGDDISRNISLSEHMSEVLASGLEVLQSIYNNQLQVFNNRLALMVGYLTIIGTALLVPNTIATIASNGMFTFAPRDIPIYLFIIVTSTVIATFFSWWAVKKLGLLPKNPER